MLRYIARRLLGAIPVLWGVATLVFVVMRLLPGDPAALMLSQSGGSAEAIAALRAELGLDQPVHVQYLRYLGQLARGDLGMSLFTHQTVAATIANQLGRTVELALAAMLVAAVLGSALGILAALRPGSWLDRGLMAVAVSGVSVPVYWSGLLLIWLFSARLRWLPATGQGSLAHLVMPALVLGLASAGALARLIRSALLDALAQDFVTTARAKGLGEAAVVVRHALANALIPSVTMLGLQFGFLLGGTVVTETVFARQGVGRLVVDAILWKDFPLIQGIVLLTALVYTLMNLSVDVLYAVLDPRIRYD
jgi:peptide/nickel transport system permease protein